jgi:hypothetical protein
MSILDLFCSVNDFCQQFTLIAYCYQPRKPSLDPVPSALQTVHLIPKCRYVCHKKQRHYGV